MVATPCRPISNRIHLPSQASPDRTGAAPFLASGLKNVDLLSQTPPARPISGTCETLERSGKNIPSALVFPENLAAAPGSFVLKMLTFNQSALVGSMSSFMSAHSFFFGSFSRMPILLLFFYHYLKAKTNKIISFYLFIYVNSCMNLKCTSVLRKSAKRVSLYCAPLSSAVCLVPH